MPWLWLATYLIVFSRLQDCLVWWWCTMLSFSTDFYCTALFHDIHLCRPLRRLGHSFLDFDFPRSPYPDPPSPRFGTPVSCRACRRASRTVCTTLLTGQAQSAMDDVGMFRGTLSVLRTSNADPSWRQPRQLFCTFHDLTSKTSARVESQRSPKMGCTTLHSPCFTLLSTTPLLCLASSRHG